MKNGSKLARSTGSSRTFSASARVENASLLAAVYAFRWAFSLRVGRSAVHRRRRDDLAVAVGDEHRHRRRRLEDDLPDDCECGFEPHSSILAQTDSSVKRLPLTPR